MFVRPIMKICPICGNMYFYEPGRIYLYPGNLHPEKCPYCHGNILKAIANWMKEKKK